MSGFVFIVNHDGAEVPEPLIAGMTTFLSFRGPDRQSWKVFGSVGIGHALLNTDVSRQADAQPFSFDSKRWIVGDVRLDGRQDLITRMGEKVSVDLRRLSDTGVVLAAYDLWDERCVDHLQGDFSFVIWEKDSGKIFAARDQLGVRPFYFASLPQCLVISNTLNVVRLHPQVSSELNSRVIGDFLLVGANNYLDQTYFRDIGRLQPGHSLVGTAGRLVFRKYWRFEVEETIHYQNDSDYIEHFNELLDKAVSERLSWNSAGLLMSGGLDSTTVAAAARRSGAGNFQKDSLRAYTVVTNQLFEDEEIYYSRLASDHLGIEQEQISIDDYRLFDALEGDSGLTSPPGAFLGYARRRYHHYSRFSPVLLTGQGGDLLLRPSAFHLIDKNRHMNLLSVFSELAGYYRQYRRFPRIGLRTALRHLLGVSDHAGRYPDWLNAEFAKSLSLRERYRQLTKPIKIPGSRRQVSHASLLHPVWADTFDFLDPGETRSPVSIRHPLLDLRLVAYCMRLPSLPWCVDKYLMRRAAIGRLPAEVLERKKTTLPAGSFRAILKNSYNSISGRHSAAGGHGLGYFLSALRHNPRMAQWLDIDKAVGALLPLVEPGHSGPGNGGPGARLNNYQTRQCMRLIGLHLFCELTAGLIQLPVDRSGSTSAGVGHQAVQATNAVN